MPARSSASAAWIPSLWANDVSTRVIGPNEPPPRDGGSSPRRGATTTERASQQRSLSRRRSAAVPEAPATRGVLTGRCLTYRPPFGRGGSTMLSVTDNSREARGDVQDIMPVRGITMVKAKLFAVTGGSGVVVCHQPSHLRIGAADSPWRYFRSRRTLSWENHGCRSYAYLPVVWRNCSSLIRRDRGVLVCGTVARDERSLRRQVGTNPRQTP